MDRGWGSILSKFIRWFRGPKKYILYLARRGRPLILEEITAYSIEEAKEEAEAIIDSLNPEEIPDLRKYRYFIIRSEDGREVRKIRNPFHSEEGKKITPEDIEQITLASMVEIIPQILNQGAQFMFMLNQRFMQSLLDSYLSALGLKQPDKSEKILETVVKVAEAVIAEKQAEAAKSPEAPQPKLKSRILDKETWRRIVGKG